MKLDSLLSLIGNTPLVGFSNAFEGLHFEVFGKLELLNFGGSIKDRAAINMFTDAWNKGLIDQDTTLVESTSGNMGIALAQICASLGMKFICVTDANCQAATKEIISAFGADVRVIERPHPERGLLGARLDLIAQLLAEIPNSFNLNQYHNPLHPAAHEQTIEEIVRSLGRAPDYLFLATSTCGTLRGMAQSIRRRGHHTKLIAVDAAGSVIFGGAPGRRLIPGHGAAVVPPFFAEGLADDFLLVEDMECVNGCRHLLASEGICAGGSSGGIVSAIQRKANEIPRGAQVVMIVADRGERYLGTVYSDAWVLESYGELPAPIAVKEPQT